MFETAAHSRILVPTLTHPKGMWKYWRAFARKGA